MAWLDEFDCLTRGEGPKKQSETTPNNQSASSAPRRRRRQTRRKRVRSGRSKVTTAKRPSSKE